MNKPAAAQAHPAFGELVDYWFGDLDTAATDAVDEHLMHCEACGAQLDSLIGLGQGVREAFTAGRAAAFVSGGFVERLAERGLQVREYRVARNGSVACSVAPDDDVLVSRLQAPLQGVSRLDAVAELSPGGDVQELRDIPFDAARGEVVMAAELAQVRTMPAHELRVRLLAVDGQARREIGHYTFRHTPYR
ncbi:MAG: zf-HC2 domain-containing protein [Pseudomonadota bacterium]